MGDPFLGEVRMMSFDFAPKGWAFCNGQLMPVNQNQALFSLLGAQFGGNGLTTFALPDLRGRTPIHQDNDYLIGQSGGEASHALSSNEIPAHNHTLTGVSVNADNPIPTDARPAVIDSHQLGNVYSSSNPNVAMATASISETGSGQAHPNVQPYLTLSFCIALQGIFPSRN